MYIYIYIIARIAVVYRRRLEREERLREVNFGGRDAHNDDNNNNNNDNIIIIINSKCNNNNDNN